jgi:DNA-directed RNA polymerase subunit RPC12/RpoP
MFCSKCGPDVPPAKFNHSGTICDTCWAVHDMDRYTEIRPAKGEAPVAPIVKLESGKYGILCPHCDYSVHRTKNYFYKNESTQRCPRCMEHYIVKLKEAK